MFDRPKDWDEKYGPWGTPPDYTPPMTTMTNIQSPLGLRIGGVFGFLTFISAAVGGWMAYSTGYPMGEVIVPLIILVLLGGYMTWWCFHLANRRAKWLREKKERAQQLSAEG